MNWASLCLPIYPSLYTCLFACVSCTFHTSSSVYFMVRSSSYFWAFSIWHALKVASLLRLYKRAAKAGERWKYTNRKCKVSDRYKFSFIQVYSKAVLHLPGNSCRVVGGGGRTYPMGETKMHSSRNKNKKWTEQTVLATSRKVSSAKCIIGISVTFVEQNFNIIWLENHSWRAKSERQMWILIHGSEYLNAFRFRSEPPAGDFSDFIKFKSINGGKCPGICSTCLEFWVGEF